MLDTISMSTYAVENASYNDHVSPMVSDEPRASCYAGGTRSAWYQITTSIKGQLGARLMDYTRVHSIALYRGTTFADLVELACMTFPPTGASFPEPLMRPGESVYLQVIADGTYWVSAVIGPTRFIDNFADAEDLSVGFLNFGNWTTENATVDLGEPLPCGGERTAWLRFVPVQSGLVTFTMLPGQNDVLAVYRGSGLGDLQLIGCGAVNRYVDWDLVTRVETRLTAAVVKDVTYYVQIGASQGSGGGIVPLLSRGASPPNDAPETAIFLDEAHHSVNATTIGAFTRPLTMNCGIWETVWYRVSPDRAGTLEVTADSKPTASGNYAPALAVHRADTGELVACGNDTIATVTFRVPVVRGTSYLIAVQSAGAPGDFRLHWEVK